MPLLNIINEFPEALQEPVLHLVTALREERGVSHEDFSELKGVVQELAEAQKDLAEAQKRTENRVEELTQAQRELAEAQKRTENRVEELAEAQKRTEQTMQRGFREVLDNISALGSRWGIQNESTIRNMLRGVLGKTNYSVTRGYYGNREVDIIIRGDDMHIMLEITSALKYADIPKYLASADDYEAQTGVAPLIMVAAPHVSPLAMEAAITAPRTIKVFSIEDESALPIITETA